MPSEYPFKQTYLVAQTIKVILNTIKNNQGIKIEQLLSKLHVNPPYCSNETSAKYLKDLATDGKIKIDKDGKISICH